MPALHVLKGVNEGQKFPLDGDQVILGRDPDCGIVIPVTSVNRKHAQILRIQGRYFIEDRQSRNGTYVNDQAITARTPLKNNDKIRISNFVAAFVDGEAAQPSAHEMVATLAAGPSDAERKDFQVLDALASSVADECRRLRVALEVNHVFYDRAESNGLHQELTAVQSRARKILAAGFHRLVVLDAQRGLHPVHRFDIERFLRYVHDELVQAFQLHLTVDTYHLENIAQVLKDEPRSLFCFLNLQLVPLEDLGRLRGFAQELHQALFLCRGRRELPQGQDSFGEEDDSEPLEVAEEWDSLATQPADRLRGLLDIASDLNKTLDLDALLPKIAESLFGLYRQADRCFIIQAEEGTRKLMPRVVKTRRPQDEHKARPSRTIVQRCLDTAQGFLSDEASRDERVQLSQSVVDFRMRSVMCVPLCDPEGKPFGVIQLDTQDRSKKFTQDDLKLLWGVANQAAIALDNARLHAEAVSRERRRRDLELAHRVQLSFLPARLPDVPGYEFFAHYEPANEVGGDYYGFIPMSEGRLAFAVGDVAGKGVSAALLMAKLSSDTRFSILTEPDLGKATARLNDLLYEFTSPMDRFVTFSGAILDPATHTMQLVNAGHMPPVVHRNTDGTLVVVTKEIAGPPLGIMDGMTFDTCELTLAPGDSIVMFSDGVPDSLSVRGTPFTMKGIEQAIRDARHGSARTLGERLSRALQQHAAGRPAGPHDDVTLVCVGRRYREASARD
jgi:serine phosphatase RsbU (regulator of sigma subunit)/pSer/pThr/pTyr-binding forkhead associated (FHA) protein